uniref:Putative secreted protein n=1 Tax=Ixodes scapularis TaxID=6945 RepID=A0A4D5S6T7_IXOSC
MKLLVFPLAGELLYFALMVCQSASQDPLFPASCNIRDCSYIMRRMRRLKKILIGGKIKKRKILRWTRRGYQYFFVYGNRVLQMRLHGRLLVGATSGQKGQL